MRGDQQQDQENHEQTEKGSPPQFVHRRLPAPTQRLKLTLAQSASRVASCAGSCVEIIGTWRHDCVVVYLAYVVVYLAFFSTPSQSSTPPSRQLKASCVPRPAHRGRTRRRAAQGPPSRGKLFLSCINCDEAHVTASPSDDQHAAKFVECASTSGPERQTSSRSSTIASRAANFDRAKRGPHARPIVKKRSIEFDSIAQYRVEIERAF
jgi:hypothetical protein